MIRRVVLCLSLAAGATSCGTTAEGEAEIQNLDRPVDLAFACYGQVRILGDGIADPADELVFQPMPLEACRIRTLDLGMNVPAGQEDLPNQPTLAGSAQWFGFVAQSASGTVAVIQADIPGPITAGDNAGRGGVPPDAVTVRDGDELTPGKNALSVGSQPLAIATDPSGCYMATANAGSCDLSVINVDRVIARSSEPLVRRQTITSNGMPLLARPAAMIADTRDHPIGQACPATPVGLLYIAYPECHAVAVVDAATGVVQESIQFDATGTASLGGPNLSCPAECGMRMPSTDGGRPVTIELQRDAFNDSRRLAIGLDNRPVVTVVDLDAGFMPTATIEQYELEGDVGVIDVALSPVISMTGEDGWSDEILPTRTAQFLYAVATDATVRVVDVLDRDHECDTQIDPRYLRGVTAGNDMSCFTPGVVGTPPRAFARGPGIQFPGDDAPLSVVITAGGTRELPVGAANERPTPYLMIGHFAMVTSTLGLTYVVNIDDDNYFDTYRPSAPLESQLALGMPHQLRDGVLRGGENETTGSDLQCDYRGGSGELGPIGGPRAENPPTSFVNGEFIAGNKGYQLPYVRQLLCEGEDATRALPELMFATPADVRADVFPDLRGTRYEEDWTFQWEGALSLDDGTTAVDGPSIRTSPIAVGDGAMRILDPARPFCAAGVEKYDHVQLRGCDPTQDNRQCGLGETCYVHPDSSVSSGTCVPTERVDELASLCRNFMISERRFAVQFAYSGELVLSERRRVLRTSPATGCTSNDQCTTLANEAMKLTSPWHPIQEGDTAETTTDPSPYTWACGADPTRAPGIDRCQMTCSDTQPCEDGTVCSGGFCLEGTIPAPECVSGLQRYTLNATEALVAIGDRTGYIHNLKEGAGGLCEPDPDASPLAIGRVPLTAPPCVGDGVSDISPNPCSLTVNHTELIPDYPRYDGMDDDNPDNDCDIGEVNGRVVTRQVKAIRFRNQVFNLHITDLTYPGDAKCRHDRLGTQQEISSTYPGYAFGFHLVAGFLPLTASVPTVLPTRIVKTPDGVTWVVDEGDVVPVQQGQPNLRGQVVRIDPDLVNGAIVVR